MRRESLLAAVGARRSVAGTVAAVRSGVVEGTGRLTQRPPIAMAARRQPAQSYAMSAVRCRAHARYFDEVRSAKWCRYIPGGLRARRERQIRAQRERARGGARRAVRGAQ